MNKQQARSLLMDYLYDEISTADKEKLKIYLSNHPEMQKELEELGDTHSLLKQMPEVESAQKLHMVEPKRRTFDQWLGDAKNVLPHSGWGKAMLAAAACLVFLLIIGSAVSLQVKSTEAGTTFSLGYENEPIEMNKNAPRPNKMAASDKSKNTVPATNKNVLTEKETERFFTDKEAKLLLAKLQQQNKALLKAFAQKMNQQDQQQLKTIVKYFQAQRIYDLKRIKQSLSKTQLASAYRWQQTNQMLGKIIQAASFRSEATNGKQQM